METKKWLLRLDTTLGLVLPGGRTSQNWRGVSWGESDMMVWFGNVQIVEGRGGRSDATMNGNIFFNRSSSNEEANWRMWREFSLVKLQSGRGSGGGRSANLIERY